MDTTVTKSAQIRQKQPKSTAYFLLLRFLYGFCTTLIEEVGAIVCESSDDGGESWDNLANSGGDLLENEEDAGDGGIVLLGAFFGY